MHLSPAKHSYAGLQSDYLMDTQTDGQTEDKVHQSMLRRRHKKEFDCDSPFRAINDKVTETCWTNEKYITLTTE